MIVGRALGALIFLLCFTSLALSRFADAQSGLNAEDTFERQQLIDEGKAAHARGDHKTSLVKFKKALELQSHPSLEEAIATEAKEVSSFAEALMHAHNCLVEAMHDKSLNKRKQFIDACHDIEESVRNLVGHLVVNVADAPTDLTVRAEGREIKSPEFGDPYPVTPGLIVVEATAPGYRPFRIEVRVGTGQNTPVAISLVKAPDYPSRESGSVRGDASGAGIAVRLDDVWSGRFDCPRGTPHGESFRIAQVGRALVATKVVGDSCVPAGAVTWQGNLPRPNLTTADLPLTIPVRITVGQPNGGRSAVNGRLVIDGPDHMGFVGMPGPGYTRGEQNPTAASEDAPLQPAVEGPPPDSRAVETGPPFDVRGMLPVAEVWRRIVGRDPLDTAARQAGAFSQLGAIVRIAAAGESAGNRFNPATEQLLQSYANSGRQADQRGEGLIARSTGERAYSAIAGRWFAVRAAYDNEGFRRELLPMCSPAVQAAYGTRRR
jgi:hypothetical protein